MERIGLMRKKTIAFLILLFVVLVSANNSQYEWSDANGCSYCLYGHIEDGKCVHVNRKILLKYDFEIVSRLNNNDFRVRYPYQSALHVYCENEENYCNTIKDSMVVKLKPSIKERKSYCKEQRKKRQNTGMFYSLPIYQDDFVILCDFVKFDYKLSYLRVSDVGICPIRVKGGQTALGSFVYTFINLYITKRKKYEIKKEVVFSQAHGKRPIIKKDFFTLGDCSNSNCKILNYVEEQPQDFDVKCDFIKKKDGQIGNVQVLGEGVCPIEALDKDGKKQVYRVRSVKDGDGYKLLMTNKRK
jgi:hypothetical protein